MAASNPLTEQDLTAVREELSAGTPVTVWFTAAAVGVPAGKSAKVVAVDDAAEGDFIQVKPAGSRDTVFCSPGELTRSRPPRKQARKQAEPAPPAQPRSEDAHRAAAPAGVQKPPAAKARAGKASTEKPSTEKPSTEKPSTEKAPAAEAPAGKTTTQRPAAGEEKAPARPRTGGARTAARPAEVTVTLNSSAEGEWTVEVAVGRKRSVRATPVQPGDVAKAARSLPSAVADAIESSLEAARRRQVERVERLQAELDAAQRTLQELSG
ncbi:MAG TPA: DUF6319 family protein [Pseudonocardia sp.]|nr:DUF6319 family protein [Pseudonocardia sp.]